MSSSGSCNKSFCSNYMLLNPEDAAFADVVKILFSDDIANRRFVDCPAGTREPLGRRWIIFISIMAQKFLQAVAQPLAGFGTKGEHWLNLLNGNGGFFGLIKNSFKVLCVLFYVFRDRVRSETELGGDWWWRPPPQNLEELLSTNELESGRGKNQIGSVQRPGDTRWSSHLRSLHSVRKSFKSILLVLKVIINEKNNPSFRASADGAYDMMTSFEFVFILHFMIELLEVTDDLCEILQCQNQDILNAMDAIINTKVLIDRYRESGYDKLLDEVKTFCGKYEIAIPDMNGPRCSGRGRIVQGSSITLEHHYRFDIFRETTDLILQEMKTRFNEDAIELLKLSSALDPRDGFKSFSIDNICELMKKFYPDDFTDQEKMHMKYQLELFELDIRGNELFQNVSTLVELCQLLSKTGKAMNYYLVDRLVRLILTLPVSTATTERAFSSMKIVKTRLRNKMEDDFLTSSLLTYIEKDIAEKFDVKSLIDEFDDMKKRRVQLQMPKRSKS